VPEILKQGWTRVAFGDVVRLCRERSTKPVEDGFDRYVGLEHLEPGDLKIRRWGNVADGITFTSVFRSGQVLFGKRRAYQRKVALVDFDGVCSGDIYVLESKNEHLLPELLPFICQTDGFFEYAVGTSAGSLSPRTNWKSLASYEFTLPPLDDQRRIAEVLGALEHAIESPVPLVGQMRVVQRRLRLDQFPVSTGVSNREAQTWSCINDVASFMRGLTYDGGQVRRTPSSTTIECVGIPSIAPNERIDPTQVVFVDDILPHEATKRKILSGATLLVGSNGNPDRVGNCVFVPSESGQVFGGFLIQAFPKDDRIRRDYLFHLLASPTVQAAITSEARGSTGLRNLNLEHLKRFRFPLPNSDEQFRFCALMSGIHLTIENAKERLVRLQELKSIANNQILGGTT